MSSKTSKHFHPTFVVIPLQDDHAVMVNRYKVDGDNNNRKGVIANSCLANAFTTAIKKRKNITITDYRSKIYALNARLPIEARGSVGSFQSDDLLYELAKVFNINMIIIIPGGKTILSLKVNTDKAICKIVYVPGHYQVIKNDYLEDEIEEYVNNVHDFYASELGIRTANTQVAPISCEIKKSMEKDTGDVINDLYNHIVQDYNAYSEQVAKISSKFIFRNKLSNGNEETDMSDAIANSRITEQLYNIRDEEDKIFKNVISLSLYDC